MSGPAIGFKKCSIVTARGSTIYAKNRYAVWDGKDKRRPKRGELYLSGAYVKAYETPVDLDGEYFIARVVP